MRRRSSKHHLSITVHKELAGSYGNDLALVGKGDPRFPYVAGQEVAVFKRPAEVVGGEARIVPARRQDQVHRGRFHRLVDSGNVDDEDAHVNERLHSPGVGL